MDLECIMKSDLRIVWIAGTRNKSLTRSSIQKSNICGLVKLIKTYKLSLRLFSSLMFGICILWCRLHEILTYDLRKSLELEKPKLRRKPRKTTISRGKPGTPPSEEKLRGHQARPEEITLAEAPSIPRQSISLHEDLSGILEMDFEAPNIGDINFATPPITPDRTLKVFSPSISTIKRKKKKKLQDRVIELTRDTIWKWLSDTSDIVLDRAKSSEWQRRPKLDLNQKFEFEGELQELWENYVTFKPENFKDDSTVEENPLEVVLEPSPELWEVPERFSSLDFSVSLPKPATPPQTFQTVDFSKRVHSALKQYNSVSFAELCRQFSRKEASKCFLSTLVLARCGDINITQLTPFGCIKICS